MVKNSKTLNGATNELTYTEKKVIAAKLRKSMFKLGMLTQEQKNCQSAGVTVDEMQIFSDFYRQKPNSNVAFARTVEKIALDKKSLKRTDPQVILAVRAGMKELL